MPPLSSLRVWYGYTTGSNHIPLFNSSRIHALDFSAWNYRTEHEYYIDTFFRHRCYHGNHNRDELSLAQAWSSFIANIKNAGHEARLKNLNAARNKFEQRSIIGARTNCTGCFER